MRITNEQLQTYKESGLLLLPRLFSPAEVNIMKSEIPAIFGENTPRRIVEKDNGVVRSVYGSHATNEVFQRLSQHPRIVEPATQILDSKVYLYQFKINAKAAFGGDVWQWHQDYVFWRQEDGMPTARVTNVAIFLDEMNEFNGPLFTIPGSHREGVIDTAAPKGTTQNGVAGYKPYQDSPAWISHLTADLKYSLDRLTIARLVAHYGIVAPKGPPGSVLFFDANLVHASSNNISPFDRTIVIVTFNSVENIPIPVGKPRPEFLASRDHRPIVPLSDDTLFL